MFEKSRSCFFVSSCLYTMGHIGKCIGLFKPRLTSSAGGAKGCIDHRFRGPPVHIAQLLTLHQHRADSQYRTANQQSPIQLLTKLIIV